MPTPNSKPQPGKRQPLTLNQLASYDDILTDALVDHLYYWTTIPKNRPAYHASRGVREEEVAKIIQEEVVLKKDLEAAEKRLLATDGLRRFSNALKTDKEKTDFKRHLRRYAQIYMPDCPFEVNATNRYTIVSYEAALTARRHIKRNEAIKYLSGIQVVITPEEEREISVRKKDFSIVVSSRNKCTSLFMGPARFANHDCGANAKLMTTSNAGIEIIAVRAITPGEEITVTYGDNYFGENNCECLCQTCENKLENGWAPLDGQPVVRSSIEEEKTNETYSLRRRRRDDSVAGSSTRTSSANPETRQRIPRLNRRESRLEFSTTASDVDSPAPGSTPRGRKRPIDALATPPVTPAKKLKHLIKPAAVESSRGSSESGSASSTSGDVLETDVTSPEKESPDPDTETESPSKRFLISSTRHRSHSGKNMAPVSPQSTAENVSPIKGFEDKAHGPTLVDLSRISIPAIINAVTDEAEPVAPIAVSIETVEKSQEVEDDDMTPKRKKYERRTFLKQTTPPATARTSGDYVLTPMLLSQPESAWVQCMNCVTYFVQHDAYYTRSSCPRCERHSKVYGYVWPKTDKAGPGDKEERVLDHRLIHRFLHHSDEQKIRGRKDKKAESSEREETAKLSEADTITAAKRGRGRPSKSLTLVGPGLVKPSPAPTKPEEDTTGLRRSGRERRVSAKLSI